MDEEQFKSTLFQALKYDMAHPQCITDEEILGEIIDDFPNCNLSIEYTGLFTYREWNTYQAVLHLAIPVNKQEDFERAKDLILQEAARVFGKVDDYYLTDISFDLLPVNEEIESLDLTTLNVSESARRAIADATAFMTEGNYSSAIDRVHTALHAYLRKRLSDLSVEYEEHDTLTQLYTKLYNSIGNDGNEIDTEIKKVFRSASNVISVINDIRNRHSLAHPNEHLIGHDEALLVIEITTNMINYIEKKLN